MLCKIIRIGRTVSLFPSVPLFRATRVPHSSSDIPAITSVSLLRVLRYATFITISLLVLTLFTVLTGRFIYPSFSLTSTESLQVGYPPTFNQTLIHLLAPKRHHRFPNREQRL